MNNNTPAAGPDYGRIQAALTRKALIYRVRRLRVAALAELQRLTGQPADDDDRGMFDITGDALQDWVDDLEARVGYDVGNFRAAVLDFCEARAQLALEAAGKVCDDTPEDFVRVDGEVWDCFIDAEFAHAIAANSARAEALLMPLCPPGWKFEPMDPRGLHVGGGELWEVGGERRLAVYVETSERRWVALRDNNDDGERIDDATDDALRAAVRRYFNA